MRDIEKNGLDEKSKVYIPVRLREQVRLIVRELSHPILFHLRHTRKLAAFTLDNYRSNNVDMLSEIDEQALIWAISYHDFGKKFINANYVHRRFCKLPAERKEYERHTWEACSYIEQNCLIEDSQPDSFERYLYDCCRYHHEFIDGSGQEKVKGKNIPFVAKLCAVVDVFDNYLNGSMDCFDDAVNEVRSESGKRLDPDICEALTGDTEKLREAVRGILNDDKGAATPHQGVDLCFYPVIDTASGDNIGYEVQGEFYDPYFGRISPDVLVHLAEENGLIHRLDKIMMYKLFNQMEQISEQSEDMGFFRYPVSAYCIKKKGYAQSILNMFKSYGISPKHLHIAVSASLIEANEGAVTENIDMLSAGGVTVGIDNFGETETPFDILEKTNASELILSRKNVSQITTSESAKSIISLYSSVASKLGMSVSCRGVDDQATLGLVREMGVGQCTGTAVGLSVDLGTIIKTVRANGECAYE